MFTGIIEESAVVNGIRKTPNGRRLSIDSRVAASDAKIGDSISVNGVCLTVVDVKKCLLSFDISAETLNRSNLGTLKVGERINIERSLRADSRLGGHFVTGHIDCTGRIISKKSQGEFTEIAIEIPACLTGYLVEKGSVAVDGISLTITGLTEKSFTVVLIPHTLSTTTLGFKKRGDSVNIEADILAKYIQRLIAKQPSTSLSNISKDFLTEHGFL